jgi:hypothetical protein
MKPPMARGIANPLRRVAAAGCAQHGGTRRASVLRAAPSADGGETEPINWPMALLAFVVPAVGGALFGYDIGVTSGALAQPQALGLSAGLRAEGYALLCVAFADKGNVECELQDPDEVYEMQFGEAFAKLATDKNSASILRDDLALEIAAGDE